MVKPITTQRVAEARNSIEALFNAIPKSKRLNYLGDLNELYLFPYAVPPCTPSAPPDAERGEGVVADPAPAETPTEGPTQSSTPQWCSPAPVESN